MKDRYMLMWVRIIGFLTLLCCITPAIPVLAHEHGGDVAANMKGPSLLTINTSVISLCIVVILIILLMVRVHKQGPTISQMSGMMVTMTLSMTSSLVVGTVAGLWIEQLFLSAVIGVVFGIIVGGIAGFPLSLLASMDGMLSGIMGGMMGAMFGVMVTMDYPTLSIIFVDIIFVAATLLLYKVLET
ncbi:hypothetical protein [Paenibacillus antarcticus]|uniref:Uncharacterized protein n=1 Tax=Paenibacillus antarcticus TaxID=253703 RepID=A0A162KG37_9BACL|nr:hypothetical protein [Paenibacillus antarcticus]OAB46798.1 hypothetical protein PBAT_08985 [Paenibacillus antarcticus]